jgi:hypothetical protein
MAVAIVSPLRPIMTIDARPDCVLIEQSSQHDRLFLARERRTCSLRQGRAPHFIM